MKSVKNDNVFTYKTADGEIMTATNQNGVVTVVDNKNNVRKMPVSDFKKEFMSAFVKFEKKQNADTASFLSINNSVEKLYNSEKNAFLSGKWSIGLNSVLVPSFDIDIWSVIDMSKI